MLYIRALLLLTITRQTKPDTQSNHDTPLSNSSNTDYDVAPTLPGLQSGSSEVPWLVSIEMRKHNDIWVGFCSGSIIKEDQIVTAAHCFEGYNYLRKLGSLNVVAGSSTQVRTESAETYQRRQVSDVIVHSKYNFPSYDIALVTVHESFTFNDAVLFIDVAREGLDYPCDCWAAGFTRLRGASDASSSLSIEKIKTMSKSKCKSLFGRSMRWFICSRSLLSEITVGDSGGPLMCSGTLDEAERPPQMLLVGVVIGKNSNLATVLFTRLSEYADWIDRSFSGKCTSVNVLFAIIPLVFEYVLFIFNENA